MGLTLMLVNPIPTSKTPLLFNQFPSLSMLTHSNCTLVVSTTTGHAVLNSTTVSSLSVTVLKTVKTTGWLKTPGALPGVNPATSDSETPESAAGADYQRP